MTYQQYFMTYGWLSKYDIATFLCHTDELLTRPYGISIVSHTDELLSLLNEHVIDKICSLILQIRWKASVYIFPYPPDRNEIWTFVLSWGVRLTELAFLNLQRMGLLSDT